MPEHGAARNQDWGLVPSWHVTGLNERTGNDIVYSASCSTVLIPDATDETGNRYFLHLYFPPRAGKFDGFSATATLDWDGEAFSLDQAVYL